MRGTIAKGNIEVLNGMPPQGATVLLQELLVYKIISIAPHTTINDIMEPSSVMFFVYREEVEKPTKEKIKLKMPIIIEGQTKEYIFAFDPKRALHDRQRNY